MAYAFGGVSARILGTEDQRVGYGIGIQRVSRERKFSYRETPGYLVLEGYYLNSVGDRIGNGSSRTNALGFLASVRYEYWQRAGYRFWFDLGWGLQFADNDSPDVDSRINSTPTMSGGLIFTVGKTETYVGIRYLHISNGGTNKPNRGQNQFHLMVGARFK